MRKTIVACLLLHGCFNPNLDAYTYACTASAPACPDGYACIGGRCQHPSDAQADAQVDAAVMPVTSGCASGTGTLLGTNVWACPATFSPAKPASTVCAATYKPCVSGVGIAFTGGSCQTPVPAIPTAFFAANIAGAHLKTDPATTSVCGSAAADATKTNIWFGCGQTGPAYVTTIPTGCLTFTRAIDCATTGSPLQCSTELTLDAVTNTDPSSGVLCCSRAVQ